MLLSQAKRSSRQPIIRHFLWSASGQHIFCEDALFCFAFLVKRCRCYHTSLVLVFSSRLKDEKDYFLSTTQTISLTEMQFCEKLHIFSWKLTFYLHSGLLCSCSGWPTGNGKKVSNSQACCLAQLCLAPAYFLSISCGPSWARALYIFQGHFEWHTISGTLSTPGWNEIQLPIIDAPAIN